MAEVLHLTDEKVPLVVDEATRLIYSPLVLLPSDGFDSLQGNIYLDSGNAKSAVTYKTRLKSKAKSKKEFRCIHGSGVIEPADYHKISISVKSEDALPGSEVFLILNGRRIILPIKMYEIPDGSTDVSEETKEDDDSRWQITDERMAAILPLNVQQELRDDQDYRLCHQVINTVYPLVIGICAEMGWQKAKEGDPVQQLYMFLQGKEYKKEDKEKNGEQS